MLLRIKGSHRYHAGETIGPGLLSKILRDVEMEIEELREWL